MLSVTKVNASKEVRGYLYSVVRAADIMGYIWGEVGWGVLFESAINLYVHVMVRELQPIMIYKKKLSDYIYFTSILVLKYIAYSTLMKNLIVGSMKRVHPLP